MRHEDVDTRHSYSVANHKTNQGVLLAMAGSASGGNNNLSSDTTLTSIFHVPLVPNSLARPPVLWSSDEVKTWVGFCIKEFSLPHICLDKFNINGKALLILTKADFLERAPEAGDVLYNVFQHVSRSKESSLTYNYQGCVKGSVFLTPVKDFPPLKESRGRTPPQRPATAFVPILPHPSPSAVVRKEESPSSLQDVPASMLSPAPTEKYSSDSDSCPTDSGPSPSSVDMDVDHKTQKTVHHQMCLNLQPTPQTSVNDQTETSEGRLLWEFIYQLLKDEKYKDILCWESEPNLIFRIKNPSKLAELWGLQKNRTNMTYEKLSRALRYYYKMKIIQKVAGKKLTYQFLQHPTQIRRGQRGARPHSQRSYSCDEDKALDTGFLNMNCPGLPKKSPSAHPADVSKARSLSPSSPPLSLSEQSFLNQPGEKMVFKRDDYPIISGILDPGTKSRTGATATEMSSSESGREEKVDENSNNRQEEGHSLLSQSLNNKCKMRDRPSSCPLDPSCHSDQTFSSCLNKKPPFKKTLSQPVSPSDHSNISDHLSATPFSSETESCPCKKPEDREASVKTTLDVKCCEKPGEADVQADYHHTLPDSYVNDSNKPQMSFYNDHSSLLSAGIQYDYHTTSTSDHVPFNSPLQENPDKIYSLDRQSQYGSARSGFSGYDQSHDHLKTLQCSSPTISANPINAHNIHRPFKESSMPVSSRLYNNTLHHMNSNCTLHIPLSTHKLIRPLKGVPSTYTNSMLEPHAHLYQPYPVHSRVPTDPSQLDCQNHGMKSVILNLPEPRDNTDSQSSHNFHYGSQVTQECSIKTFIPDAHYLPSHNGRSNGHDCPAMIHDGSSSTSDHHKNYVMHHNPSSLSFPQESRFEIKISPAAINRSLEYPPDCSSSNNNNNNTNNNMYVKFEGYRNVQEQPEDLSISVKT